MKLLYGFLFISMMSMVYAECEIIDNQIDCEALEGCEWHADEMACEDSDHDDDHDDHAHCEDFTDEESCEAADECEWHEDHCEDEHGHDDGDCGETDHFDTDGLTLEYDDEEIYSQFQGMIEGSVNLYLNDILDLSVHFLDNNGNEVEIDESLLDCYPLSFNINDPSIISIEMENHDDHAHCEDFTDEESCEAADECEWHADEMACEDSDHDDDHGHDEHVGEHIFEITGLSVGSTTFTISIMHQGHADYTSLPILVNVTENCLSGDVNQDQLINIIDVVQLVQAIISGNTDELSCVDLNNDGNINIVDVVALVQFIVNTRTIDATEATLKVNTSDVTINANGYIGGVQMTLVHENDFSIELTNEAYVADYNTVGNQTMLVIVAPENNELFTYNGDFEILDYIVANSSSEVSTTISEMTFDLGVAYPNPFNPTTNLSLTIPEPGYVNVSVFNIVGQQIAELANGNMDSGVYNLTWNAFNASSGMYLVKAEYSGLIITQKLMLLK